jgi:hypothetical protein
MVELFLPLRLSEARFLGEVTEFRKEILKLIRSSHVQAAKFSFGVPGTIDILVYSLQVIENFTGVTVRVDRARTGSM